MSFRQKVYIILSFLQIIGFFGLTIIYMCTHRNSLQEIIQILLLVLCIFLETAVTFYKLKEVMLLKKRSFCDEKGEYHYILTEKELTALGVDSNTLPEKIRQKDK